jgi:hypothetical protein
MAAETATTVAWHGDEQVLVGAVRALLGGRAKPR